MRRRLIAAYVASALLGSTGLAFAHSDLERDASAPSGANSTTMDESSSSSAGSSFPSDAAGEPSTDVSSLPSEEPSAMSGINASEGMQESASSEFSGSEHSAPQSYSLYPESSEQ